ncbi:hypothetical protein HNP38_000374 [Chryseobacterium defluvii]|uniref:Uncharacterized protein n=1 Tax=Chryseobacterium defluvii TaxID=160396 RepID=A0A840KDQ9_9FLAO|nr:hypothetical protein [Chryseobacterium defluvii]
MKKNLIILSLCLGVLSYSQVGINTPTSSVRLWKLIIQVQRDGYPFR